MGKIRINKLAQELNVNNDQILAALKDIGHIAKNFMSSVDNTIADKIRKLLSTQPESEKVTPKATKKLTTKKTSTKVTSKETKATINKKPSAKKSTKVKSKAIKKTTKKSTTSVKKAKVVKTTVTPPTKEQEKKEPVKVLRKYGLKIVKHEEKPKKIEKKPPVTKEKFPAKPKNIVTEKPEQKTLTETPKPEQLPTEVKEEVFEVAQLPENIMIRDLGEKLNCSPNDIIKELMDLGVMTNINQSLSFEVASKVADKRGFEVELIKDKSAIDFEEEEKEDPKDLCPRPPIVTIMGHVDHGKTSLLDTIRKTNVTVDEAGGITQHIGAYRAKIKDQFITFLDTPGHEAFTAMRARGAQVTDLVILVVAADDGIKPQTKEAIDHAHAGNVPILVAINKIDKPEAKPEEVKKQLADVGLLPEDWGGQTMFTEISAIKNIGIDHLLELVLLQAEIMELKANPTLRPQAIVIESRLDKGRGPVATVIVQKGTLSVGQPFVVGPYFGKIRALIGDGGNKTKTATPAIPVEIVGMPEVPQPGDKLYVVKDEKKARQYSEMRLKKRREVQLAESAKVTMEDLHDQIVEGKIRVLNIVIKADTQGTIAAVQEAFSKLETEEIKFKIIHDGVGGITESDILLSSASNAITIGFNVRPTDKADELATREKVDVRLYSVIYEAIEDMKKALEGLLEPKFKEIITGRAEVREVFNLPKIGSIAGCHVSQGKMERNLEARLIRDSIVVYQGKILSIRRFKEDVKEVQQGYECGVSLENFQDIKQGDVIQPYILEEIKFQ